jgi:hypothetical protein
MADYERGVLGPFNGLVGTVVGAVVNDTPTMRIRPKKSKKEPGQSQLDQRFIFALMMTLLKKAGEFIKLGIVPIGKKLSPMNTAMRINLDRAITGVSPDFKIDYSKIVLSTMKDLDFVKYGPLVAVAGGRITVAWDTNYGEYLSAQEKLIRDTDTARIFFYSETTDSSLKAGYTAARSTGSVSIRVPFDEGDKVHVWCFFVSKDEQVHSASKYLGSVIVLE